MFDKEFHAGRFLVVTAAFILLALAFYFDSRLLVGLSILAMFIGSVLW